MEAELQTQEIVRTSKVKNNITDFLQSVVIAISVCIVIYIVVATPNQIEGLSMEPNFDNAEIVLTSKVHQWLGATEFGKSLGISYQRGDVIVFQKPGFSDFIKRIVGMPGDKIELREGKVYINGEALNEPYLSNDVYTPGGTLLKDNDIAPLTVPEGSYFAMGDNRTNSHDSRYSDIGFIKREWFKGKVLLRYWPLNKFEVVGNKS